MRNHIFSFIAAILLILAPSLPARGSEIFSRYFLDETLRVDYYHIGDAASEMVTLDRCYRSGGWAGSLENLTDPVNLGKYAVKVYDKSGKTLLFSRGYNSIFEEYQSTEEAAKGNRRTYEESALIPFPRSPVIFSLESRGKDQKMKEIFRTEINPEDTGIITTPRDPEAMVFPLLDNGDRHHKVDLLIMAEGYRAGEKAKFLGDAKTLAESFFEQEPYRSCKKDFNVWAGFVPSKDSGCSEPGFGSFKNTALCCTFDSLGSERYLLTEHNRDLRNAASMAPYDTLIIMVNTKRYGGGGIYGFYATCIADNQWKEYILIHEFGHSFAGLADEYYTSKVEYNDFYSTSIEPLSPNITALLPGSTLKWKNLVAQGTPIPTPWDKKAYDDNDTAYQAAREKNYRNLQDVRRRKASAQEIAAVEQQIDSASVSRAHIADEILMKSPNKDIVGAFEGAGYRSEGLYRPMVDCIMFTKGKKPYCRVCEEAIRERIRFFSR